MRLQLPNRSREENDDYPVGLERRLTCGCSQPPTARGCERHFVHPAAADPRGVIEAARGLDNAADDHPQAARRCAPHNQRMQQSIPSASKLASSLAPDPQHYSN